MESGDSATSGTDFTAVSSGTLTFTAGDTEKTFTVSTTEDTTDEENETFTVTLSSASNASISDATAKGTIEDDDLPVVTIARDKNLVNENEGDAGFTLTRVGLTAGTLAVTVEVTQEADRDLLPDGAEAMRTVTFAAGSATAALAVALENDNLQEVLGGVTVEVQPGTAYTVGDPASATVTVVDTDNTTATPANLTASPGTGVGEVTLAWDTHALHVLFVRHQYRYKTDGAYGDWTDIPNSGQHSTGGGDGSNLTGYTVTGLVGGQAHTFEVRTAIPPAGGEAGIFSDSSNEDSATPRSAAVSFEAATYSVDEGATVEVTVSLSGAPGREVTVAVTAAAAGGATAQGETGADWSGVPENVTFGATDTEQSFTLAATQDMVDDDSEGVVLSFGTLPDGVTAGTLSGTTVTIVNDDAAGATVSATALTVTEQDATGDSYTVVLDTEPTHDVTVTVGGHSGTDVSLSASTLTFTTSNWDQAQTVTVTALNDDDTADDAVTLTHTAASTDGNYSGITIAGVSVTVTDNDTTTPTVTLALSDGSIGENGGVSTVTATVSPASAAAFTVTVAAAVSPAVAADFELSTNRVLSFAENATTSTGTVTITGVDDDVDAADKTVTVSGTVSATGVTAPANRTLTLEDDDAAGATVSATALTVTEQDTTGDSYTVVLDTEPTHEVTVTVGGHAGTDVSLSASTLIFTTSNWDGAQTVTVTARNDDDTADDAVALTHTAASTDGNYSGITIAGVAVTVTDNDTTTPTVTLALSAGSVGENGGVSTVTATVSPASAAAFTVTVAAAAVSPAVAADFRLSANQVLSFAENATTSTGEVTITGVDNDVDAADKTVTVSGTVSATSVTAPATRTLTLEDDDAAGVTVSATALTVTEQDTAGDSYTVVLDTEPTHDVTVTVGGHAGTDVSLSASALTFTPSNWDRAQTVTVTALNDDDTADDAVTLTHAAASTDGNYSGITIAGVAVTVTDNDTTTPTVTLALSDGSIGENGGVSTVTATVSPASAAAFTVTVAAAAVSPAVAADFELSANQVLSFAENATTSTGTVTITGVDDDVDAADKTVTVSGTVSATGVTAPPNRTLTLEDDDAAGATVSATALTVTEQDTAGDSYTVVLDTEPTHDVTVTVGGHAGTDVSLSASTLTFTPSNWDQAQTVTVTALNDDDTADDAVTLTHAAASTDGNYSGITIAGVAVTVTDNDTTTPTVTLALSDGSIGENGGVSTVTATVSPASAAAFTVTVAAAAAVSPAVAADFELSANRVLSFAENATTSTGTVTITGVDNDVDAADKTVTVSGTVSATGVTAPVNRTLTLEDDDAAGVTVSATALTVTEQDTAGDSYTVVLDTEPTHEVTVTVGGHAGTDVSLSASTLTFTPSNWDRAQTVTVTALNDDDTADDAVTLTHAAASTDGNYSGITIAGVAVTVTDNDTTTPTVTLALSDGSIGENGGVSTVTATVSPASAAAFTVTVAAAAVAPAVAADFRLSANTVLRFAENATTSTGTVTITGVDNDVDAADKTVTVSATVSATSVTAPATRTLTLEDDDAAGVTVSATALTVTEQDAAGDSYTVVLDTEPTHAVTVTVGGHSGTDVSLSASTLIFTTSNWDQAQTVTVTALNDDDTADDAVTLTHTATSTDGNYSGIAIAGVAVAVTDNDTTTPTVTLVLSGDSIGENGGVSTVTATVSPASAAAFTVTVAAAAVSPAVAADFELSANQVLSFAENATTSTGEVTITGVDNDVDAADKTVTVSGTVSATGVTAPANRTLTLEDDDDATPLTNNAPVFDPATAERKVAENSAADTNVGAVIPEATDADNDTLTYSLEGDDARFFDFDDSTRQITTKANVTYNYEAKSSYSVRVKASDGTDSATLAVTIRLTDVLEQSARPAKPRLSPLRGSTTSLSARWTRPGRNGGPAITGYDVQYREAPAGGWMGWPHDDATVTTTITGLTAGRSYQARVRAKNGERDSEWSEASEAVVPSAAIPLVVESVIVASAPQSGDTYRLYETILFTVTFSEPVEVKPHGRLRLEVGLDTPGGGSGSTVEAVFSGLSQSPRPTADTPQTRVARHMHFEYKVQLFDRDVDGVRIGANALRLASEVRIRREGGSDAELDHAAVGPLFDHKVDGGTADVPVIERIGVVSTPRLRSRGGRKRDTYGEGENIRIEVRFDQPVHVEGDPTLALEVGDPCRSVCEADYESGSGTDTLVFAYLVLEVDIDLNGIEIPADPIEGDSIRNAADQEAQLSYRRKGTQRDHKVDGSRAAGSHLSVEDAEAHEADGAMEFTVRLEPHGLGMVRVDYATADGTARAGSDYTETSGTLTFESLDTERTVSVPILDDAHEDSGETFTLTLSNPDGAELRSGDGEATGTIHNSEIQPLTASFEGVPAAHDGEGGFRFRVAFSEDIGISYRSLREDAFAVTGGRVTRGARVDDRRDLFEMTVEPDGGGAVTIELPAGRECGVSGAICTKGENRRQLTNSPSATVAGPPDERRTNTAATGAPAIGGTPRVGETLTASTSGIADADGLDDARFAHQWMRADADIPGATGPTYTAVAADEGRRLKVRVGFTDDAGHAESLASAATDAVAARSAPLTASFEGMPAEHRGEGGLHFRVAFSEDIGISYRSLREDAFAVSGGRVTGGRRVDDRRDLFRMTVRPDSDGDVTITLPAGRECGVSGAICTKGENRRQLTNSPSATVTGPVGIEVADARVEEGDGAVLAFLVTLSRAAGGTLTVDYATADGSAHAGADYRAASGTLEFRAGESSKTVEVAVFDDSHDEGEETLTLRLSNASSGRVTDAEATGTIKNTDPLPRALLARFGRTAAVHVVEHVEERLQAPREPGFRGRFAGRELRRGMERDMALGFLQQLGGSAGVHPAGMGGYGAMAGSPTVGAAPMGTPGHGGGGALMMGAGRPMSGAAGFGGVAPLSAGRAGGPSGLDGGLNGGGFLQMGLGGGDLLTGSDFAMNRESRGGILSLWSRGAQSRFSGREGALSLGGDVRTTMFGADYAKGPVVAGLSLSNSRGLGHYAGAAGGQVASSVTGLYPWLGYQATERVTVWGVAGYGTGGLLLTPDSGQALESGLSMAMAAAGTRGELLAGGASGFGLAFKADALWVGTAIDGVDGPAGRLKATDAAVTRFRTGLEGSWAYTLAGRLSLTPSVEVGLRHDGGDAETGAGMDVGAGLVVSDAGTGLAVDVRVRTLLVHQDKDFSERGVAVSLSYNPTPSTPLGFLARVAPSWGGQAMSGAEALWGRETMAGMAHGGVAQDNSLDAEVGYGLPMGSRFVGTPKLGLRTSEYGQDYRLGYGLGVLDRESLNFQFGVEAQRRNSPMQGGASNGVLGQATVGW